MTVRPRRSVLYMPGSNARAIEKARTLPVDAIILDLEDAVAPAAKPMARGQVVAAVKAGGFGHREVFVRINALDTSWSVDDLTDVARAGPDAILLPKIENPEQINMVSQRLFDLRANPKTRIWIMIETLRALFNVRALAEVANDSEARFSGFVMGTNDIVKETRSRIVPGRAPMLQWFTTCIASARLANLEILDGVYNDIANVEGFARECVEARDLGFDGKTLIHPSQIEACNAAFSPSAAELAEARNIIALFDRPENTDKGVLEIGGRMVERMHADIARRTVAIADAITKQA
jgi:citrate lyase subunit beta/citryl-CoA lyase